MYVLQRILANLFANIYFPRDIEEVVINDHLFKKWSKFREDIYGLYLVLFK